jgi:hypothetical protein
MSDRERNNPINLNILARYERGDAVLVDPMDYVLLDNLAPEGTMFAGAYPDGPNSVELAERLFEGKIKPSPIAARLRLLHLFGLATMLNRRGVNDRVWQVTPKGREVVEEWKRKKAHEEAKQREVSK